MVAYLSVLVLLTWLICSIILVGIGSLLCGRYSRTFSITESFWVGLVICSPILTTYHFFRPIDPTISIFLAALGLCGILLHRRSLMEELRKLRSFPFWVPVCFLIMTAGTALRATGPCEHYDTGLYGAGTVRWLNSYPSVRGLANVHGRFGFNSGLFLYHAVLEAGPWQGLSHHLFTGLILVGFIASVLPAFWRLPIPEAPTLTDWFLGVLAIPALAWMVNADLVGTDTDLPSAAVCLVAFAFLCRALDLNAREIEAGLTPRIRLLICVALFALSITFKLSNIALSGVALMICLGKLVVSSSSAHDRKFVVVGFLVITSCILLPWIVNGAILSGYFFYPNTTLSLPVIWRVPAFSAHWDAAWIRSWAIMPHLAPVNAMGVRWIGPWFHF